MSSASTLPTPAATSTHAPHGLLLTAGTPPLHADSSFLLKAAYRAPSTSPPTGASSSAQLLAGSAFSCCSDHLLRLLNRFPHRLPSRPRNHRRRFTLGGNYCSVWFLFLQHICLRLSMFLEKLGTLLQQCSKIRAVESGASFHAFIIKHAEQKHCLVVSSDFRYCQRLWEPCGPSSRPTGFGENLQLEKGLELFRVMNRQGLRPDRFSYASVFGICTAKEDLVAGQGLHSQTVKLGLDTATFVGNVILSLYSKCGAVEDVDKIFISIKVKDVITCNTYISACSYFGEHGKAFMLYREMHDAFGLNPDDFTLAGILAACSELSSFRYGTQIHGHLIRARLRPDVGVFNAIMDMYAKCGCIEYVNRVFGCMTKRNLVSWNTVIFALGYHGLGMAAIQCFELMMNHRVKPDPVTFVGLLSTCSHAGLVDEGKACFDSMEEVYGIPPKIEHLSCLIDLLGRAARLEEAEAYANMFPFGNDSIIWGSLLSSCRLHGNLVVGERVARKLLELQPTTSSPFVLLSILYASDGRWDSVSMARKMLRGSGVKKEPGYSSFSVNGVTERFTVGNISHARIEDILETLESLNLEAKRVSP